MTAIELAYKILKLHHYDDWTIKVIQSGGALCHSQLKEIWIDEASQDDIFLLLHEIAHIKYPNHDRKWADRFTCLCQRHMGWAIPMGIWSDEVTLAMPLDVPRMNSLKAEYCKALVDWPYWNVSPAYNTDTSDTTIEAANSQGFLDSSTCKEGLQVEGLRKEGECEMYYEEKIVNGVLCWRNDPHDVFTPFTIEQLSAKVFELQAAISVYTYRMNGCIALLNGEAELRD